MSITNRMMILLVLERPMVVCDAEAARDVRLGATETADEEISRDRY